MRFSGEHRGIHLVRFAVVFGFPVPVLHVLLQKRGTCGQEGHELQLLPSDAVDRCVRCGLSWSFLLLPTAICTLGNETLQIPRLMLASLSSFVCGGRSLLVMNAAACLQRW